ncbi:restriction endonuclease subunit S [Pseudoflavonifractor phocaeensis]|uniref:restriction endonuclease subunit S n=1 Tax=Pseudoflavonifractor phocaeensis TaxID=1870988 RepID=UPI001F44DFB2|nr:restriction endonuclease subunit S [Pseudoflavonifractor phocaeensis]MCF2660908.1 restriction endonuclease subunit S [Pseudoflavonifractor phocaeensis]
MARLGDICTVVSGSTPKTNIPEYWDGDVKWITPAELNEDSCYLFDSQRHISELGKEKTGLSYMPAGTVILSSRAPIGKTAIAGCELCCNQGFKNLICSDVIFNEYLYFFLKSKTDYLNSLGRGATFKEISKSIVENIEIRLPSLEEQKKAAKQLGHIYHLISLRKQQLAKLDELVKARFVELFGDPEYNNKGWKTESLGELCEVGSSKRIYQNEQSTEGVPFLRISDLVNKMDTGINDCDLYIPESRFSELLELGLVPKSGDILVTARGTLGRCYIIKPEDKFYFQDGMITWLSQFSNSVTALYISHLFTMPGFRKQIDGLQAGSTVAYLWSSSALGAERE